MVRWSSWNAWRLRCRPRLHLFRFDGVLAPTAMLRWQIVPTPPERATETSARGSHTQSAPPCMSWATRLLKQVFDIDVQHCPNCGGALNIIGAIEEIVVIHKILSHLGVPDPRARPSCSLS
jgi:hypothetical protein